MSEPYISIFEKDSLITLEIDWPRSPPIPVIRIFLSSFSLLISSVITDSQPLKDFGRSARLW